MELDYSINFIFHFQFLSPLLELTTSLFLSSVHLILLLLFFAPVKISFLFLNLYLSSSSSSLSRKFLNSSSVSFNLFVFPLTCAMIFKIRLIGYESFNLPYYYLLNTFPLLGRKIINIFKNLIKIVI